MEKAIQVHPALGGDRIQNIAFIPLSVVKLGLGMKQRNFVQLGVPRLQEVIRKERIIANTDVFSLLFRVSRALLVCQAHQ